MTKSKERDMIPDILCGCEELKHLKLIVPNLIHVNDMMVGCKENEKVDLIDVHILTRERQKTKSKRVFEKGVQTN